MDTNGAFQPAGGTTGRSLVLFEEGAADGRHAGGPGGHRRRSRPRAATSRRPRRAAASVRVARRRRRRRAARAGPAGRRAARSRSSRSSPSGSSTRSRRRSTRRRPRTARRRSRSRPRRRCRPAARRRTAAAAQRRVPARLPRGGAAPDRRGRRRPRRRRRGDRRRGRRVAGDVGPAGDEGRQLLPHRPRHPRRGARHRLRPTSTRTSPGARSPRSRSSPARQVQDGHGHGTHCIGTALGREVPAGAAALRRRLRGRDLRRQGALQRGLGRRHRDPRRHRVGGAEQVRRDLDVARRGHPAGPAVLAGVRARRQARAGRRAR